MEYKPGTTLSELSGSPPPPPGQFFSSVPSSQSGYPSHTYCVWKHLLTSHKNSFGLHELSSSFFELNDNDSKGKKHIIKKNICRHKSNYSKTKTEFIDQKI
jgi:hypothetical protein